MHVVQVRAGWIMLWQARCRHHKGCAADSLSERQCREVLSFFATEFFGSLRLQLALAARCARATRALTAGKRAVLACIRGQGSLSIGHMLELTLLP